MMRIRFACQTPWSSQAEVLSRTTLHPACFPKRLGFFSLRGLRSPSLSLPSAHSETQASLDHFLNMDVASVATSYRKQFAQHWEGVEEPRVPTTLSQTLFVFLSHPTAVLVISALACLGWFRSSFDFTAIDPLVVVSVACWWLLQEWIVHKFLLHSPFDWQGRAIHESHHQKPYFHVTVDSPALVGSMMVLSSFLFMGLSKAHPLGITATWTYWCMGLLYEFSHYVAHTRYMPKWERMRRVKINHMMHHSRNKDYWLSFLAPEVDSIFGTSPDPKTVPKSKFP
ncbi:hypothetical protein BSKO_06703 [Bryopsis sp. KO-2023]|nr:hypothetical protein BSKO_06703 [Bryopsis sp. KO-2023]